MKIWQVVSFWLLGFGFAVLCMSQVAKATIQKSSPDSKLILSYMDGNELYAECQEAEKNIEMKDGKIYFQGHDGFSAGNCWGYVTGVVDSIPITESFAPDQSVKLSQYVDVVRNYLRDNPAERNKPAYVLARKALENAFPEHKAVAK